MAPVTAQVPGWKRKMRIQKEHIKRAVSSEDVTYFRVRAALSHTTLTSSPVELASALGDDDTAEELNQMNEANAMENQYAFSDYKAETEALKGEKDPETWKAKMNASKEKAKKKVNDAIDAAYDSAADLISELPENKQDAAFDIFDWGQRFVMNAFDALVTEMKAMLNSIVNFIKNLWDDIINAWNTVKKAVSTAIEFIRGIFKLGSKAESGTTPPPTEGVTSMELTFHLNWRSVDFNHDPPTTITESQAQWSLNYIMLQMKEQIDDFPSYLGPLQPLQGWEDGWTCQGNVSQLTSFEDVARVLNTSRSIVATEATRVAPLPEEEWANVPTPDPVAFSAEPITLTSPNQEKSKRPLPGPMAGMASGTKTGATLPKAMRTVAVAANGH